MRIFSPLLKRVVYPGLSWSGCLRRVGRAGPAVLTYHGVFPEGYEPQGVALDGHLITGAAFRSQLLLLKSHYNVISAEQFRRWCEKETELPSRAVLFTCDDGLLNTLTDMLPVIRELDVPFLFFVTGASALDRSSMLWHERLELWRLRARGRVSLRMPWQNERCVAQGESQLRTLWLELRRKLSAVDAHTREEILEDMRIQIGISEDWQSEYSQNESLRRRFFMLNREQLQELAKFGITIGSHTLSHPLLSRMPEELAWHEISESRMWLERALGSAIWALAYPFGNAEAVGAREAALAKRAGFTCAFMNIEDSAGVFSFPRIHVSSKMSLPEFEAHLCGLHQSVREKYFAVSGGTVA